MSPVQGDWTLVRTDDYYWVWEHSNDLDESPIFCARELAWEWMRKRKATEKDSEK